MTTQDDDHLVDSLRCRIFRREQIRKGALGLASSGLYVFVDVEPPHVTYVGRSANMEARVTALRRRRSGFSNLLTFDFPGLHVPLATLKELEKRVLRSAWIEWDWARWTNRMDLWIRGDDRYLSPGSPSVMSVVDRVLSETRRFMQGQPAFRPGLPTLLEMTHALGGARDEVHAVGTFTASGFTVLTGSRLSSKFKSVAQLKAAQGPEAQIALDLLRHGILDRQYGTLTRMDGLYLMSDHEFEDPGIAASVLLGRPAPAELWRELTQAEINELSVPHGSHRRWR
jgi:hypothetical protein